MQPCGFERIALSKRRPNPRLVKIHRSYTVGEAARVCGVHKNTVRRWIKEGLECCDTRRPTLILGCVLRAFLEHKRAKHRRALKPGEIYCVKCRAAQRPDQGFVDLEPYTDKVGNLVGICPTCESLIYRRVSLAGYHKAVGELEVTLPEALRLLIEGDDPSLNGDFH